MNNFTEIKTPYEFLVRFNSDGSINGAHVAWLEQLYKDDVLINSKELVESVSIGFDNGFPLESILSLTLINAIKDVEFLKEEINELKSRLSIDEPIT